jgi:putative tryptophan/tyrosine transport system substrate-binding protein
MKRREFITLVGGGAAAWPLVAHAQQAKPARIGFVSWQAQSAEDQLKYLREGLVQLGYVEGRNISLETFFTDGDQERTRAVVRTLIDEPVDILIARVTPVAQIAKEMTETIPVVMISADPLMTGLVPSLSHPGANLTGLSLASPDLAGKRLELVRDIKPDIKAVAFLGAKQLSTSSFVRGTSEAAKVMGLKAVIRVVDAPEMVDSAVFEGIKSEGAEAVIVQPLFAGQEDKIVGLAMQSRLPVIGDFAAFARAGALFSLGVEEADILRRVAYFVDRILKGEKPAELPIEQPTAFRFTLNVRTAKAIGWTIAPVLLSRPDEVIE